MANDSQFTCNIKDNENTNSRGRHQNGNSSTAVGSEALYTPNLRRSARASSSKKKMEPSPLSTRKSERLEKQTPTTPPVKRKSVRVEKQTPIPLRRSERGKKQSPLRSSKSKKSEKGSGSSNSKKDKKEKSVKQLTFETQEVEESEKQDAKLGQMAKKRILDARSYKAFFVNAKGKKLNRLNKTDSEDCRDSSVKQVDGNNDNSKKERKALAEDYVGKALEVVLEDPKSSSNKTMAESLDDKSEAGISTSSPKLNHAKEALDGDDLQNFKSDDNAGEGYALVKKLQSSKLVESTSNEMIVDKIVNLEEGEKAASFKRKRDDYLDAEGKRADACDTCLKRLRVDCVSAKQEMCSCSIKVNHKSSGAVEKDRGRLEAGVTTILVQTYDGHTRDKSPADNQAVGDQNICLVCRLGGKLLCCDGRGCKQSCHLSCLDPPLEDVPLGVWHCPDCTKKKIEYGVHSVSEVESIWDANELEGSDTGGSSKLKQFFVKYKGLAHIHNRWLPESQLLLEAPQLNAKFNPKNMLVKWNPEWIVPHRLLQKRSLMSSKQHSERHCGGAGDTLDCCYEWLVKWCGLDYEHATWELWNAPFLNSPQGQRLVSEYESRRRKMTKKASFLSRSDKIVDGKENPLTKLSQLPIGGSPGLDDSNNLDIVNKLCEFSHKGQNAIIIDDPERILKVILFIVSLQSDASRPFLIITASDALHLWESEFSRLAPSVNVVVYSGGKDVRKSIRLLEFFEEGGCIMFQVLISPIEVIVEDLEVLECIGWEGIIIDDCQHFRVSSHFEQIKMLTTDMRLLLVNGQLKDSATEYMKLLAILDSSTDLCDTDVLGVSSDNSSKLKDKLSRYIVSEGKSDFSRFIEYWVPVKLSNIQLERYCAILLSNSLPLQSLSKNDCVGALCDILISTRKCCDHPYLLDPSLQPSLTEGLQAAEVLDYGIKASGKLLLLESMLLEMKNQGLRVLVLFQSVGGSGRDAISIGDILDDFLRQRFGVDSYERIDGLASRKSKQAALSNFNNKECGRFVFLLETRACFPSIKLSSVDSVIIFGSDWNPLNDIRGLQKINIDSQSKQIKLFRLYSFCTVEEKALLLGKHGMAWAGNLQSINCTTSQKLLMWGTSYLFSKLDEFHGCSTALSSAGTMTEQSLFSSVVHEFSTILAQKGINNSTFKTILNIKQNGGIYCQNFSLPGERETQLPDEELPQVFWKKLLEGKHPQWKYKSIKSSSQRNRKKVQYFEKSPVEREVGNEEGTKKRKKIVSNSIDLPSPNFVRDEAKFVAGTKDGGSINPANDARESVSPTTSHSLTYEFEGGQKLRDAQKSLYLLLKPEVSKLCETLQLSDDIKYMVEKFFEYVMNNHHVSREPATILQAFQISLCWTAASFLKKKIDHKQTLELAKHHLKFGCNEEEADYVYSKLRCLKHMFLYRTGYLKIINSPKASSLSSKDFPLGSPNASNHQEAYSADQLPNIRKLVERDISRSIKKLQKKCKKQLSRLIWMHQEQVKELCRIYEEKKAELESKHKTELAVVNCLDRSSAGTDRLKMLENAFATKVEEYKQQLNVHLEDLREIQLSERKKEEQKFALLEDEVKSWSQVELLNRLLSDESRCLLENMNTRDRERALDSIENVTWEEQRSDKIAHGLPRDVSDDAVRSGNRIEAVTHPNVKDGWETMGSDGGLEQPSVDVPLSESRIWKGTVSNLTNGEVSLKLPRTSQLSDGSADEQIPDAATSSIPDEELRRAAPETVPAVPEGVNINRDNSCADARAYDRPTAMQIDQQNGEGGTVNQGSSQQDLLPLNQVLEDQCFLPSTSTDIQDGEAPGSEVRHDTQPGDPPQCHSNAGVPSHCSNFEIPDIEPVVQLQHDLLSAGEIEQLPHVEEPNGPHQVEPPQLHPSNSENSGHGNNEAPVINTPAQPTTDSSSEQPNNEEQNVTLQVERPLSHTVDDVPSENRIHEAPVTEPVVRMQVSAPLSSSSGNPHVLPSADESRQHPSTEQLATSQPALSSGSLADHPQHRQVSSAPVVSRMPLPVTLDPLQNELDRLRKEIDHSVKTHEDTKRQLKADCEKEIEEVVAQIRKKYDIKLQKIDSEFLAKKMEMDVNHNKVLVNKILAEAFRCKCMDSRASGSQGMQQDPASFRQQLVQLQQTGQRTGQRPPLVNGMSAVSAQPPSAASPRSSLPAASSHTPAFPRQPVHHSRPFASIPARPPHISPISHSAGSRLVTSEIRTPAPHLQRFRPSTGMSSANLQALPSGMLSQLAPNNHPASSPSTILSTTSLQPPPSGIQNQPAPNNHPASSPSTTLSSSSLQPPLGGVQNQPAPNNHPASSPSVTLSSFNLQPPPSGMQNQPALNNHPASSPSTTLSSTSVQPPPRGMQSEHGLNNHPAKSPTSSQMPPRPPLPSASTTAHQPGTSSGLPLSAVQLLMDVQPPPNGMQSERGLNNHPAQSPTSSQMPPRPPLPSASTTAHQPGTSSGLPLSAMQLLMDVQPPSNGMQTERGLNNPPAQSPTSSQMPPRPPLPSASTTAHQPGISSGMPLSAVQLLMDVQPPPNGMQSERGFNNHSAQSPTSGQMPPRPPSPSASTTAHQPGTSNGLPLSAVQLLLDVQPPPSGMQSEHGLNNHPAQSPTSSQIPPPPPLPSASTKAHQPGSSSGLPLSAVQLLMDVDRRCGANVPNIWSPLPDLGSNLDQMDLSGLGLESDDVPTQAPAAASNVIVCLSDDE